MTGFSRFVTARVIAWAGNAMTLVALPMLVYQRSGSALWSGVAFAIESSPYLVFGLIAGVVADRVDRRVVLVATQVGSAAILATLPAVHAVAQVSVGHIVMVGFLVSALFVFYDAATFGVVPALVGREHIASATARLVSTGTFIGVVGPVVGGVVAAVLTPTGAVAIDAVCYLIAAVMTYGIVVPATARSTTTGLWRPIQQGLVHIWRQPVVRALTAVGIGVSLANGVVIGLMVVVGVRTLGLAQDDPRLGAMYGATALGAFITSVVSTRIQRSAPTGWITLCGIGIATLAMAIWSQTSWWWGSLLVLVTYQAASTMVVINGIVVRQSITPDELQSRVNTTARMIAMGGTPGGAALGGWLAQSYGTTAAVSLGAAALCGSVLLAFALGVHRLPKLAVLADGAHSHS